MRFQIRMPEGEQPTMVLAPESQAEEQQIRFIHTALSTHGITPMLRDNTAIAFRLHTPTDVQENPMPRLSILGRNTMNTHQKAKDIAADIIGILGDRYSRHPSHANKSLEEVIADHLESELDSIVEELAPDPAE